MRATKCAARALLFVASLTAALIEDDCLPHEPVATWMFASGHKTGTVLLKQVRDKLAHRFPIESTHATFEFDLPTDHRLGTSPGTVLWTHINLDDRQLATMVEPDPETGKEGRLVAFLRDPVEVILSGYFYHASTTEAWANAPLRDEFPSFIKMAANCGRRGHDENSTACKVRELIGNEFNVSYRGLLNYLSPEEGVFVEAYRARRSLQMFNRSLHAAHAHPGKALTCSLDYVVNNFRDTFSQIFTFLGAKNPDRCVEVIDDLDIASSPTHEGGHRMANVLLATRRRLRRFFIASSWYRQHIAPIREDMGYPGETPPEDEHLLDVIKCGPL